MEPRAAAETREQIRADLIEQLNRKGTATEYFTDLVNDYVYYCEIKDGLITDIKKRGMFYTEYAGTPSERIKENSSVRTLINTNKIMLQILKDLKLNAPITDEPDDENDILL